jgi:hypothetical protein
VLARYRHLREISKRLNSDIMKCLSAETLLQHARRIGLAVGKTFVLDNMEDMTLAFDLAIHTAPAGRSRAIDRYAKSTRLPPQSDEALVLEAMRTAHFAILSVRNRHPAAGLLVSDVFRETDLWLVDEGLEVSLSEGAVFASRYFEPDGFAMTAGVCIPIDIGVLANIVSVPQLLEKPREDAIADRRFAEAVYKAAVADGAAEAVSYQDLGSDIA